MNTRKLSSNDVILFPVLLEKIASNKRKKEGLVLATKGATSKNVRDVLKEFSVEV